jgi:hypothetical protein
VIIATSVYLQDISFAFCFAAYDKGRYHAHMAFRPLNSFFPTAGELLAADQQRLGEALLVHLNSYEGQVKQHGKLHRGYLPGMLENQSQGLGQRVPGYDYGPKQADVARRVMEAWHWLERQGFLVPHPSTQGWHVISTEGEELLLQAEQN